MTLERIQQVRMQFPGAGIDALLVLIDENRRYLSGFTGEDTQFDESAGALLIGGSELILATDSRYELQARREAPLFRVIRYREGIERELPALVKDLNGARLGFESVRMSVRQHDKIRRSLSEAGVEVVLKPVENLVEDLRIAKDDAEVRTLKNALSIAENAFEQVCAHIRPGLQEKQLAWMMEQAMRESGADALSFPVIVASGPNAALPHAIPGERRLREGEPILFDWGARLQGYCSDISRTVIIGEPDDRFRKVFQTVLDAQRLAIEAIQAGVSSKSVDKIARDHIERQGFGGRFGHGLGHGTGLAIHEAPRLSPLKDTMLAPGMVTTVEPGIYLDEWGGVRIENMVVVRDNGCEVLNASDPGFHRIGT